ncbi:MAG: AIR synthase-related protein, partial [Cyanobacteriota bacterium]|nr:AIR synthase-related protein [Cyanobacteriota bacterium]
RGDGRPGDWLVSSGPHGLSRLGLALLQAPEGALAGELAGALRRRAIRAHQRPRPRFDAVRALIASRPAAASWRVGGCDSSDGLAAAVAAVAAMSGCAARLERAALPIDPALAALADAEAWCLGGGEDFELVLALEPPWAAALVEALPGSGVIGALVAGAAGELGWADGQPWPAAESGWRHFG